MNMNMTIKEEEKKKRRKEVRIRKETTDNKEFVKIRFEKNDPSIKINIF